MASSRFSILRSCRMGSYPGIAENGYTCCFTYAASSRTVRQATERSVDEQILHVRRVGHQSHSRDRHQQGCHHGHARGNGRSARLLA